MPTRRLPDAKIRSEFFLERPHFACRIRKDLADMVRQRCSEINCSQGVFLEILIAKGFLADIVKPEDVYQYSAADRWLERAFSDFLQAKKTGTTSETEPELIGRMRAA